LQHFVERGCYFFQPPVSYEAKGVKKHFNPESAERLEKLADLFNSLKDFSHEMLEKTLKGLADGLGIKTGELIHPTRLAVTGMITGPGLYEVLELLGRDEIVERMGTAARYIREKVSNE
jgi:glutamyl-tRNA synthetase